MNAVSVFVLLFCFFAHSGGEFLTSYAQLGEQDVGAGSPDPVCKNVTTAQTKDTHPVVPSDSFYKQVTKDKVHIVAAEVDLYEGSPLYDPCKDFYLETVTLRIQGRLRWKASNIYITAVNVTVVGGTAALDVSYQSPGLPNFSSGQAAASGAAAGAPGNAGAPGGSGGEAGNATLYLGLVYNGTLQVLANGGPGGRGQDGGDGHQGAAGKNQEYEHACCHSSASTQGHPGGKGGAGGAAGTSGDGGHGGVITVYTLEGTLKANSSSGAMSNITLPMVTGSVQGGPAGPPAKPGKPGPGGPGGMGSPTHCKEYHWPKHGHKCDGPPGKQGDTGQPGDPAPATTNGTAGQPGELYIYAVTDMAVIGEHVSSELVQIAVREANKRYRNSDFTGVRDIYVWVNMAMKNTTNAAKKGYAHTAAVKLMQMSKGLDYWAHSLNNMPMNSYASIFKYLNEYVLQYLKDVEAEWRVYFSAEQSDAKRMEIVRNTINHNKFTINVIEKDKQDLIRGQQKALSELEDLICQQTDDQVLAEGMVAICQNAIQNEIEKKESSKFGWKEIFTIAKAVVKIYGAFYTAGMTLDSGVDDLEKAITAFNDLDGSFIDNLFKFDEIQTIVHNFKLDKAFDNITSSYDEIVANYRTIEKQLEQKGQENSAKILSDGEAFDKQYDKWLYLPECSEAKIRLKNFLNMSQAVNDKIMHHDAIVVKIATIDAEVKALEQENAQLQSKITNIFDPNLITYSLAVGRVLYSLKDAFVDQMKRLHESYMYQFLEKRKFTYDDSSVAMLEAWMATNTLNRLERMEQIGNQVEKFNLNPKPLQNSIVLRRADHPEAFDSLDKYGNMSFVIAGSEDQLATMTHAHMTAMRIWLPGAKLDSDHLRVWVKRYGTSQVYDQQGQPWTFTHGARTMLFDYSTKDNSHITPDTRWDNYIANTQVEIDEDSSDYVALSPIGPWSLSVSKRYNPGLDTSKVDAIYLQLSYSFLPCAQPECPIRSLNVSSTGHNPQDLTPAEPMSVKSDATIGIVTAVCCGLLIVAIAAGFIIWRATRDRSRFITHVGWSYDSI